MATVFDDILLRGVRKGELPGRTQRARDWFRQQAKTTGATKLKKADLTDFNKNVGLRDYDRFKNRTTLGKMYFFNYDPKNKATLPYLDRFPLIFKVQNSPAGFEGLNLHYLPPILRAKFLDALLDITNNKKYDQSTKFNATYSVLKKAAKFKYFKPCVKHYLSQHVKSRFAKVNPPEWEIATFLPTADFAKASRSTVYTDSRKAL